MGITFNGIAQSNEALEDFASLLGRFDLEQKFELWISASGGQSISMLRNGSNAWLMYLRFEGDSGSVTKGAQDHDATCTYMLANGQVDEYPLRWCIPIDQCYEAIAHFIRTNGGRYDLVAWQES
ncbi:Imm1 family immunity protein [Mesorhizobium sp.]|uniref:Imm1 family immunity protein n=1 Tax=Mesorhizobium sp. TaxID=1871066 RepID=UPI0025ED6A46|nr:Imm1 family immunity protein [Mesorhizobium sp.]